MISKQPPLLKKQKKNQVALKHDQKKVSSFLLLLYYGKLGIMRTREHAMFSSIAMMPATLIEFSHKREKVIEMHKSGLGKSI